MKSSVYEEVNRRQISTAAPSLLGTLALAGLLSTILLIMVGSFVRVSGNGLGCPDWPGCYGHMFWPTEDHEVDQANMLFIDKFEQFWPGAACPVST